MSTDLVEQSPSGELTPMQILQTAVDANVDTDKLEKLMELQERWEKNQAEKAFAEAMHLAQQEMPAVVKDALNTQNNSRYARLESVQSQCRKVWQQHGFSLCFAEGDCPIEKFKRTLCDVTHEAGHTRRYHLDLPIDGIGPKGNPIGGMNALQGHISSTSYAQRRLICMVFNIVIADEDRDGVQAVQCISEDQIATLNSIMERIHPDDAPLEKLLKWAGIESLDKLPLDYFLRAKESLQKQAALYEQSDESN